jgi:hypothetical protein
MIVPNGRLLRRIFGICFVCGILFIVKGSLGQEPVELGPAEMKSPNILHVKEDSKEYQKIEKGNHFLVKESNRPRVRPKLPIVQPIPKEREQQHVVPLLPIPKAKSPTKAPLDIAIDFISTFDPSLGSIPKLVHQSYGVEYIPKPYSEYVAKLKQQKGYTHILWTDYDLDQFVQKFHPSVYPMYRTIPLPPVRIDLAKYLLLYSFGGYYCDIEVDVLMDLDKWTDRSQVGLIVGIESILKPMGRRGYSHELLFAQYVLASTPGHEIIAKAIYSAQQRIKKSPKLFMKDLDFLTGNQMWTDAVLEKVKIDVDELKQLQKPKLFDDVYILPKNAFGGDRSSLNGQTRAIREIGSKPIL